MARRLRGEPWSGMSLRIPGAVVAESIKVLYVPAPKAACSSLKRLISEAAGTYDESALLRITTPNITPEQAVHQLEVNGFTYFRNLHDDEQHEILSSDEWWRVSAVRNPYARLYSAFENNLLLFAGTLREGFSEIYSEVMVGERLDLTATFANFVRRMAADPEIHFRDDHFRPQVWQVSPDAVRYTHWFKVEQPGAMDDFALGLSERSGRHVRPRRLNEGLGLKYPDVMSAETARLIEGVYWPDFEGLGYEHETFPDEIAHVLLSENETRMLRLIQRMWLRQWQMSVAAKTMRGFRYGTRQVVGRAKDAVLGTVGRRPVVPEEGNT